MLLTREIVHETGLCCHNPFRSSLAEDGNVALGPLTKS